MEIIIGIDEENLSSIQFLKDEKVIMWHYLTSDEQIRILKALENHWHLFSKFIQ